MGCQQRELALRVEMEGSLQLRDHLKEKSMYSGHKLKDLEQSDVVSLTYHITTEIGSYSDYTDEEFNEALYMAITSCGLVEGTQLRHKDLVISLPMHF